jgi:tetratricopeptide (TPR) repeat protein
MRGNIKREIEGFGARIGVALAAALLCSPTVRADDAPNRKQQERPKPAITFEDVADLGMVAVVLGVDQALVKLGAVCDSVGAVMFRPNDVQCDFILDQTVVLKSLQTDLRWDGKVVPMSGGRTCHVFIVEQIKTDDGEVRLLLSNAEVGLKGWVKPDDVVGYFAAKAYFTGLIERSPRSAEAYYQRGSLEEADRGVADLAEAIRLDPAMALAHVALAKAFSRKKDNARALAELNEAIRIKPELSAAYYERSRLYNEKSDADHAIADLTAAIRLNPTGFMAYDDRAMQYMKSEKWDRAIADLTEAIRIVSRDGDFKLSLALLAPYHINRGLAYGNLKKYDLAIADFLKAVELAEPFSPLSDQIIIAGVYNWAFSLYSKQDYGHAVLAFSEVIKRASGTKLEAVGYAGRARARYRTKDVASALADYDEALRHNPDPVVAAITRIDRSKIESDRNDLERALDDCAKAIELLPNRDFVYLNRARVLTDSGRYDRALADCDKACAVEPKSPWGHDYCAWIIATCPEGKYRDGKKAVNEATRACELTEWKSPTCLETLAAAAAESGDFEAAAKWQSKAIELLNDDDETKARFRDRLELFRKRQPYRDVSQKVGNRQASHSMPEIPIKAG